MTHVTQRRPPRSALLFAASASAAVLALAACSAADNLVASLDGGSGASAAATSGSADPAGDYLTCLQDNGVSEVKVGDDGLVQIGPDDADTVVSADENGTVSMEVNGVDYSEPVRICTEQVPEYQDLETTTVENFPAPDNGAALEWTQCARDNGFTDFADPEQGVIIIPPSLTAGGAQTLIDACPLPEQIALASAEKISDDVMAILQGGF